MSHHSGPGPCWVAVRTFAGEPRRMMDWRVRSLELQTGLGREAVATHSELWDGRGRAPFVPSAASACSAVRGAY